MLPSPFSLLLFCIFLLLLFVHLLPLLLNHVWKNKQVESRINLYSEGLLKLKGGLTVSGQVTQSAEIPVFV